MQADAYLLAKAIAAVGVWVALAACIVLLAREWRRAR